MSLVFDTSLYMNGTPGGSVDQTYDPTSPKAQSGTAVAQALTTVSVDIDNKTITENSSEQLQTVGFINRKRDSNETLKVWTGDEEQYDDDYHGKDAAYAWLYGGMYLGTTTTANPSVGDRLYDWGTITETDGSTYVIAASVRWEREPYYDEEPITPILNNSDICFIQGKGIKKGDTFIANNGITNEAFTSSALTILGEPSGYRQSVNIGDTSEIHGANGVAIGDSSSAGMASVAIGSTSEASGNYSTAIGQNSHATEQNAFALGTSARATAQGAIQIGGRTNSEPYTLYCGQYGYTNWKLLDLTTGKIPADRLPSTSTSIDNTTITENASNELQASAVMNARTGTDVMPIWQGTEQEWTNGKATDWYNWKSNINAVAAQSTNPDSSWYAQGGQAYGNGVFIKGGKSVSVSGDRYLYSDDNGESWVVKMFSSSGFGYYNNSIAFGNGVFVVTNTDASKVLLSEDGINWTEYTGPGGGNYPEIFHANEYFFLCGYKYFKKSKDGINWENVSLPATNDYRSHVVYGNGIYVIYMDEGKGCYTSDDFQTFNTFNISTSVRSGTMAFCNGVFILQVGGSSTALRYVYRSTNGYSWSSVTFKNATPGVKVNKVLVAKDTFFIFSFESPLYYYSKNGLNWQEGALLQSSGYSRACAGDSTICVDSKLQYLQLSQSQCYTIEAEPTTASTVYSAPDIISALTITSIGTGTITLSDNNTYTYTSSGDVTTYQTIGDAYPNYLANINGVGVKIGNTLIADNTDTSTMQTTTNLVTSVSSASTDTQYPSAKLLYDTVGNIEATLDAIIAQGSNS